MAGVGILGRIFKYDIRYIFMRRKIRDRIKIQERKMKRKYANNSMINDIIKYGDISANLY